MQQKGKTFKLSWTGHTPMTKQTTILTFLPKPIGRPYFRLDLQDITVAFCGGTPYGPLK
tara:strand:- start:313 stop:489 length:177 start_codon:yes stop_codon:yes gene_type:complete